MKSVAEELDAFELPEWLGEVSVTWHPEAGLRDGPLVRGRLTGTAEQALDCDLLAVDEAYPVPVADDGVRTSAHQAWRHGQVLLVSYDGRATLAVPGREFTADLVLESLARLARAVGAAPENYAAVLRIGRDLPASGGSGR